MTITRSAFRTLKNLAFQKMKNALLPYNKLLPKRKPLCLAEGDRFPVDFAQVLGKNRTPPLPDGGEESTRASWDDIAKMTVTRNFKISASFSLSRRKNGKIIAIQKDFFMRCGMLLVQ